jgi:hypothetical protein
MLPQGRDTLPLDLWRQLTIGTSRIDRGTHGFNAYVYKPTDVEKLLAVLRGFGSSTLRLIKVPSARAQP